MSGMAHFFMSVGGSKFHERLAHFFIDIYNYYLAYGDALSHLALFKNDDSVLYKRIEIVDSCSLRLPYVVLDFQDMNCSA